MKRTPQTSLEKRNLALILFGVVFFGISALRAQEDLLLEDTEKVLNSEELSIDGTFQRPKPPSAAEIAAKNRLKMQEKTDQMILKKVEDLRLQQEMKIGEQIDSALNGSPVPTELPAVVAAPTPAPTPNAIQDEKTTKVTPYIGLNKTFSNRVDYESKFAGGVDFSAEVLTQLFFGVRFNYQNFDITHRANNAPYYGGLGDASAPYFNDATFYNWYHQTYGNGRLLNYEQWSLEVNSRLYLFIGERIRPYVGAGLAYNRAKLQFEESNNSYNAIYKITYGEERFSSSYFSGVLLAGTEVLLNSAVGLNFELKYARGFNSDFNQSANGVYYNGFQNQDQQFLNGQGKDITSADSVMASIGLVINF